MQRKTNKNFSILSIFTTPSLAINRYHDLEKKKQWQLCITVTGAVMVW